MPSARSRRGEGQAGEGLPGSARPGRRGRWPGLHSLRARPRAGGGGGPERFEMIRTGLSARAFRGARSWVLVAAALSAGAGVACALEGNDMPEPKQAALPLAAVQGIRIDEPTVA